MSEWQNWGGDKSWPAPQARAASAAGWHGPPDPVFDGGPYRVVEHETDQSVLIKSEVDESTGLQQTRSVVLGGSGAIVETTITNHSDTSVRVAPWEIMQVAVEPEDEEDGLIEVWQEAGSAVLDLGQYWGSPRLAKDEHMVRVAIGRAVAKLGFVSATGRVGCRFADSAQLDLRFLASDEAPYAAPFHLWLQTPVDRSLDGLDGWRPTHRLIELEPVGPLLALAPGRSSSLTASWTLSPPEATAILQTPEALGCG